jgi:hypothetical protein
MEYTYVKKKVVFDVVVTKTYDVELLTNNDDRKKYVVIYAFLIYLR